MDIFNIILAFLLFAVIGAVVGFLLAIASKVFEIKTDERIEAVKEALPGVNCGGCGYAGCEALAEAIVSGEAKANACVAGGTATAAAVSDIMGVETESAIRLRAQVMCSGTNEYSKKKYIYAGAQDCLSAVRMGGGDKLCPNGCIGKGSCVFACQFDAIKVEDGVAVVDYELCTGCGACVAACPKYIIKLIPFDSAHWVGCMSVDKGAQTRKYCDVGCISCRLCEKNCPSGAIKVTDFVAAIDYSKCIACDKCVEVCPRKIIWSGKTQSRDLTIKLNDKAV
ncbi:MAG: RnfABCDGE type electron transport complex subunit B [Eubacteriales bacterium]|jgi:electron transport complex protein RnfB|nr:RnfABCDGE type electron transport complex subunit B [Eubacteriales bacterium]